MKSRKPSKGKHLINIAKQTEKMEEFANNKKIKPKLNIFSLFKKQNIEKKKEIVQKANIPKKTKEEKITPKIKPKLNIFGLFKKKKIEQKEGKIDFFKKQIKTQVRKRALVQERRHKLRFYLERAGLSINPESLSKKLFNLCVFINLVISAFLIYHFSVTLGISWSTILLSIITLWILVFVVVLFILWVLFYLIIDLKIFKRRIDIEDVLPDYLQLTASNIKAGMTIDRALWYAVRPRFGVLANEIEIVAKETMRGEDLKTALKKFADKYNSVLLKRSINLLIEGIEAGGEIGNLLNKIAINVQENKIMRKEMAANVTTYVIFISVATIGAAPILFALSGVLIKVISTLGTSLSGVGSAASAAGFALTSAETSIKYSDFRIFAIVSLIITSFFSAIIIATIRKGNAKLGLKYIPIFIMITTTLFFIADKILEKLIGTIL